MPKYQCQLVCQTTIEMMFEIDADSEAEAENAAKEYAEENPNLWQISMDDREELEVNVWEEGA